MAGFQLEHVRDMANQKAKARKLHMYTTTRRQKPNTTRTNSQSMTSEALRSALLGRGPPQTKAPTTRRKTTTERERGRDGLLWSSLREWSTAELTMERGTEGECQHQDV